VCVCVSVCVCVRACVCVRVCVCVRAGVRRAYLEQAVLVAVLAEPHSAARGELHLRRVYDPLVNPANDKSEGSAWL